MSFDIGYTKSEELKVNIEGKDFEVYVIKGQSLREITRSFLYIIGKSYLPPKWAFGYIQSRWSYENNEEVFKIANEFIKRNIPCDGICLDLDYMDNFKDFSLNEEKFPKFKSFVAELKEKE